MRPVWRVRQFACVDAAAKVVAGRTSAGIGDRSVVGWRVRWDGPGFSGRSRSFTKASYDSPTAAHRAAQDFVDALRAAARHDAPADARGWPLPSDSGGRAGPDETDAGRSMTLAELGKMWLVATGGEPKTVAQHERSLKFALAHLPEGVLADDVTTAQLNELLLARRFQPGPRAAKLVRMGALDPDDDRARMCSLQTEKVFVQDLRRIFAHGMAIKPPAVRRDPMVTVRARKSSDELLDPSNEVTFSPDQIVGIAELIDDRVFRALVILRAVTALRTGEAAALTVDDVDQAEHLLTVRGTEGEAPRRLTPDGTTRSANRLKRRQQGDERLVDYPDTPFFNTLMHELIEEAKRRHHARDQELAKLVKRYRAESGKQHLAAQRTVELRAHRATAARLFTMPDGGPFKISDFDKKVWKPTLATYFPVTDPSDEAYQPLRESNFYNLRSSAIEFLIEQAGMEESAAAEMAGHSIDMQRRAYRKRRGNRQRAAKLDRAAGEFELPLQGRDEPTSRP
jgi:integrase